MKKITKENYKQFMENYALDNEWDNLFEQLIKCKDVEAEVIDYPDGLLNIKIKLEE